MIQRSLAVVIPAYNEENRLPQTLLKILAYLTSQAYDFEIVVVDDGSQDHTVEAVRDLGLSEGILRVVLNPKNMGKGFSVRNGVFHTLKSPILFSDADLSTPIEELAKLWYWLEQGYDLVIGSRALTESEVRIRQKKLRQNMGKIFNQLVQSIVIKGISDTQCGFKLFNQRVKETVINKMTVDGFAFDVELLYLAQKNNLQIRETPVVWYNSPESKVSIFLDPLKMLLDIVKIRIHHF